MAFSIENSKKRWHFYRNAYISSTISMTQKKMIEIKLYLIQITLV